MALTSADIRTLTIVGHGDSAKTTLAEAMLFKSGAVKRMGRVAEGTATLDYDPGVGNLSLYVWDRTRDQIALIGGKLYGSQSGTGRETLTFTGKALVAIQGVDSTSAPYTLTIAKK